jgi:hypothetical protein
MTSLFNRASRPKSKRHQIAEYAALLTFLRESDSDAGQEYAKVIGEDDSRCVVEVGFGNHRPMQRQFYSVTDGTCGVTTMTMKEAVEHWGVQYER